VDDLFAANDSMFAPSVSAETVRVCVTSDFTPRARTQTDLFAAPKASLKSPLAAFEATTPSAAATAKSKPGMMGEISQRTSRRCCSNAECIFVISTRFLG
jgi:hypothetical protein